MVETTFRAYKVRWYILTLFSLVSFGQNMVYSTWGPIAISADQAFNLNQTDLALLPNWYNIGYFIALFPYMWIVQEKGMRPAVLLTAILVTTGAGIRSLSFSHIPEIDKALIHIGQALNGLGSPVTWFACTELSEIWFPPSERALATSIGLSAGSTGVAVSFLGPMFIGLYQPNSVDETHTAIRHLLYMEVLFASVVLVLVIVYFPPVPPTPPSYTATVKRLTIWKGLMALRKSSQAWIMISVYAVSTSVFASWDQIQTKFLEPAMSEEESGWLGIVAYIVSILSGPALSLTSQFWMKNYSKLVCALCMTVGCVCIAILTLASIFFKTLFTKTTIWTTLIISSIAISAPQPIWWELSCDAAYPVAETTVSGISSLASCVGSWIFFFLYMFPSLGTEWPTWTLLVSEVICIPAILIYKSSPNRSNEDEMHADEQQLTASEPVYEMQQIAE